MGKIQSTHKPQIESLNGNLDTNKRALAIDSLNGNLDTNKRALIIGINYTDRPDIRLNGCINDAWRIYSFLLRQKGYEKQNILLLIDKPNRDKRLIPTRKNIIRGMKWLTSGAAVEKFITNKSSSWVEQKAGTMNFFHFSGHGSQIKDGYGDDELDGKDETICPLDIDLMDLKTQISDDAIKRYLIAKLPRYSTLFATLDCCHSGTCFDLPFVYDGTPEEIIGESINYETSKVICLSSCLDNQLSAELPDHFSGAMTEAFLRIMNENTSLTYEQLLDNIKSQFILLGIKTQNPCLSSESNMDWNDTFKF